MEKWRTVHLKDLACTLWDEKEFWNITYLYTNWWHTWQLVEIPSTFEQNTCLALLQGTVHIVLLPPPDHHSSCTQKMWAAFPSCQSDSPFCTLRHPPLKHRVLEINKINIKNNVKWQIMLTKCQHLQLYIHKYMYLY